MIKKYQYRSMTWVDLESPTHNEVREIMEDYNIDPLVAEELIVPSLKSKVDLYGNCIYLILHFPAVQPGMEQRNQEIDFIIGKNFVVTSRYESIDPLHQFSKVFEVNSILDKSSMGEHAGFIFYYMIRTIYRHLIDQLDSIKNSLGQVEDQIFKGQERQMVLEISRLNRFLLDFKEATSAHTSVLDSFQIAGKKFFGPEFDYYLQSVRSEYYKLHSEIQSNKEFVDELRLTNDSLLNTKQNEIMKVLTIITFSFFPLSFIVQVFEVSQKFVPLATHPNGFWIILGVIVIVALGIFGFFRLKKWL